MDVIVLNIPPVEVVKLNVPGTETIQLKTPASEVVKLNAMALDVIVFPQITIDELGTLVFGMEGNGPAFISESGTTTFKPESN